MSVRWQCSRHGWLLTDDSSIPKRIRRWRKTNRNILQKRLLILLVQFMYGVLIHCSNVLTTKTHMFGSLLILHYKKRSTIEYSFYFLSQKKVIKKPILSIICVHLDVYYMEGSFIRKISCTSLLQIHWNSPNAFLEKLRFVMDIKSTGNFWNKFHKYNIYRDISGCVFFEPSTVNGDAPVTNS